MRALTIEQHFPPYRTRALESMANVGAHAWDIRAAWDAEMDAQAYCLDAVGTMPAGSTIGMVAFTPVTRRFIRQDN